MRSRSELETLGFDDPIVLDLLSIRTQKDFSERFEVSEHTLSGWSKLVENDNELKHDLFGWTRKLTRNVIMALYRKILIEGDAPRVKLWMQLVEGWQEKTQVSSPAETEAMREHTKILKELANRK